MHDIWNPWHGCRKISDGCKNCYVYRRDAQYDIDSTAVVKNKTFYAPAERYKYGNYVSSDKQSGDRGNNEV